jgi:hypothetical protein
VTVARLLGTQRRSVDVCRGRARHGRDRVQQQQLCATAPRIEAPAAPITIESVLDEGGVTAAIDRDAIPYQDAALRGREDTQ